MKRVSLYILLAILLTFAGGSWFVLHTQWGLQRTYELVRHSLPGKLTIQSLEGKLLGPIIFTDINYVDRGINLQLDRLELDWQAMSLFTGTLRFNQFYAHGLTLQLSENARQNDTKPITGFALPLTIEVLDARLTEAHIVTEQQQAFFIKQILLQGTAIENAVHLTQLDIETDSFDLTTTGKFGLNDRQPVKLHTVWTVRYNNFVPLTGKGSISGSLAQLDLEQSIVQPGLDVMLQGSLSNIFSQLEWNLSLDIRQFTAQQVTSSWPALTVKGKVTSSGHLDAFRLAGMLSNSLPEYGTIQSEFDISAKPDVWHFITLKAKHSPTQGSLEASGDWYPGPDLGSLVFSGSWNQLLFPLSSTQTTHRYRSEKGTFAVSGSLADYLISADADLTGPQLPDMQLTLNGQGDQQQIKIPVINIQTLEGKITGNARAGWRPNLHWETTLQAQNLNPSMQWHDWPGRLNAQFHAYREGTNATPFTTMELKSLSGELRGYPVESHGAVSWGNRNVKVTDVRLNIGDSHFSMAGGRDEIWNLQVELTSPNLNALWPYSKGSLDLSSTIKGPRLTPHIIAKITGDKLAIEDYRIGKLAGNFDIDLQTDERFITSFTASEIEKGSRQWQSVSFGADGTRTQHLMKLEIRQETDVAKLVAQAGLDAQQVWSGEITQTVFNVKNLGEWQQARPAPFRVAVNQAMLGPWCLTQPGAHICLDGQHMQNSWKANLDGKNLPLTILENWAPTQLKFQGKTDIAASLHYLAKEQLTGDLLISTPDGFELLVTDKEQSFHFGPGKLQMSLLETGLEARIALPFDPLGDFAFEINLPNWNALAGVQPSQALQGHLKATLTSLAHLNGFFLDYPNLTGSLNAELRLGGTIASPLITGKTRLNHASVEIPALGIKLDEMNFQAVSQTGSQVDYQFTARSGKSAPLSVIGSTQLHMAEGWPTRLNIRGIDFQVANLPDIKINISPQLDMKLQGRRIDLNGEIAVPHARFRPRTLPASSVSSSQDVVIVDAGGLPAIEEHWKIYSHVRIILGEHVNFDGFGLRGEVSGNLLVIDEPGKLTVGQGEIKITEGTYKAYGQDAKIRRGRLMFANTVIDNPGIDLEAVREVDSVTAGVRVRGTLKQPELSLFSEPAMAESDIISYFLLGHPLETTESDQEAQLQKALLAARLAGGELFIDQTGIYSIVDELSFETSNTTEQTSLVIGKYLSPKLYVRYVTGIIESSNIVEIQYKLSKYFRIQTEAGYRGSTSVTGADIYYTIEY